VKKSIFPLLAATTLWVAAATQPSVELTNVPPICVNGLVSGVTHGVDPSGNYVQLIIRVLGGWWTKPYWSSPETPINPGGSFSNSYATGGADLSADLIAAYVFPTNYAPPLLGGQTVIPAEYDSQALCKTVFRRLETTTVHFAGYDWTVKDTGDCATWDPGPNHFSKSNVWVSADGKLHLVISFRDGYWRCAEIMSADSFGYGRYYFATETDMSKLPAPIVFGFFNFDLNAAPPYNEIDIEHSNGDVVGLLQPWQYVLQPYTTQGNRYRFAAPAGTTSSTHAFTWVPGMIAFASYTSPPVSTGYEVGYTIDYSFNLSSHGWEGFNPEMIMRAPTNFVFTDSHLTYPETYYRARLTSLSEFGEPSPFASALIKSSRVPPPATEQVHFNLWLFNGIAPGAEGDWFEVVIDDFHFQPNPVDKLRPSLNLKHASFLDGEILVTLPGNTGP
jgi:hypothetical protein